MNIPADEHGVGFTSVPITFPDHNGTHRIERVYHPAVHAEAGDSTSRIITGAWTEVRPACQPDSNPAEKFYELSVPYALARGGRPCDRAECYGGAA
jgi:hypothetical protein